MLARGTSKFTARSGASSSSSSAEGMHPNLGMHNAAASGNVGLVKYALENGQPANSVLNGVLPLHAGCTGGSEPVVRLLLAHGADVNAQRLKSKTTGTAPGTEGSTPLHFAAANGHAGIVKLLLEHGARPGAADKDGFLPEALAAGNGHQDSVELLRDWMASYGPNGLAPVPPPGRSSSSGTVTPSSSHQADLSASSKLSSPTVGTSSGAGSGSGSGSASRAATQSPLRSQRSFEHLTSAAAGVKASLIGRRSQLAKVNSNPNLKSIHSPSGLRNGGTAIPPVPPTPLQLPSASSTSSTLSPSQYSAGQNSLMQVPMRSPSPNSQDDGQELGFYSSMTPAPTGSPLPLPIHLASLKDSKRRPSLPSILEKAAHPAASIRAALQSNAHAGQYGPGNTDMIEELSNEGHYGMPPSPSRIAQRITGKRSLSNMLRKATGGSTSSDGANAAGSLSPSRQHLPLTRTPEDERPPQSTDSLHPTPRPSVDEDPSWPNTAPHSQTLFSIPSTVADRQGAFAARPGDEHRLRGSASSSALSSQIGPFPTSPFNSVGRSRSSSNEQTRAAVTSNFARPALSGSPPSQGLLVGTAPPSPGHAAVIPSPLAESSANAKAGASSIGHDYRPRKSSNLSTPSPGLGRRATDEQHAQQSDSSSDPSTGESSGFAVNGQRRRCQSSASASSRRIATQSEHLPPSPARAQFANNAHARQDSDDAQEFLGDMPLPNPEEAAGEHHDVHHLPPGLRSLTPGRNATSSSWQAPSSNSGSGSPKVSSGHQPLPYHRTSSSNSSGSTSSLHQAYANASTGEGPISRSPHLSPRAQCVPLAEDNGASGVFERTKRSGSHTESMASKLSNSSLRSGHVTAHEQAQAILRHAEQFGPDGSVVAEDGTQTSLSAQLAAYGEALAFERRQAAEAASGVTGNAARSPVKSSPSGREGSSQVGLLPSVSEDHHNNTPVGRPYGYSVSTDASDASSSSALKSSSTYGGSTATLATSIASGMPPPPPGSARLRARSNEEVEKGRMQTMVVPARAVERSKSIVEPPSAATRSMGRTASDGEAVSDSSGGSLRPVPKSNRLPSPRDGSMTNSLRSSPKSSGLAAPGLSARDAATDSWPSSVSPTSARSPLRTTSSTPRGPALPTSRASEDILRTRSQSNLLPFDHPSLSPTYTSTPRTPASNNSSSRLSPAPSPHRLVHRHSPSMPTELDTFGHVGRGAGTIGDGYDDEKDEAHWSADQGAIESSSHDRNVPPPSVTKSNARPGGLVGLGFTDGLAPPSDEKSHLHSQSSLPPSPPSHSYTQGDGSGDSPPDKPFNINVFGASRTSLAPPPSTTTTTSTTTGSKEYADSLNSKNTTSKRRMVRNFFSGIKGR